MTPLAVPLAAVKLAQRSDWQIQALDFIFLDVWLRWMEIGAQRRFSMTSLLQANAKEQQQQRAIQVTWSFLCIAYSIDAMITLPN
jgi:hypothetical protein